MQALGRNSMLPGPGSSVLPRVPSAGRRASSAGKPPLTGRGGIQQQPPASSGGDRGAVVAPPGGGLQGGGDALDAELGRVAHFLPPRSAASSAMASRTRRPSWGGGEAAISGTGTNADLEWQVLGGVSGGGASRNRSEAGGALSNMAIPGLPPRTGSLTRSRRTSASSLGGGGRIDSITAGPPVGGAAGGAAMVAGGY